ncbi:hypothetical protein TNIN_377821 [Trichonephila inaurata madagascariensis]|uniref:Uncharacterized protein n=1 Tax=Trichonephila inaurata madagascariensis TaxID=2747483 RepID=A0A8X6XW68_9ARAC|nr:hypothetical protein TNIN_377821 [Trichonephila inaurata madagascariensis]
MQDLEKTKTVFLSIASTSRKSKAVPDRTNAVPGDSSSNKWYQKDDDGQRKETGKAACDRRSKTGKKDLKTVSKRRACGKKELEHDLTLVKVLANQQKV